MGGLRQPRTPAVDRAHPHPLPSRAWRVMLLGEMSRSRPAAIAMWMFVALIGGAGAGCFDADPHSLFSRHAPQKIPAIKEAAEKHDESAIPELVRDLDSDDPAVRFYAIEGLKRLTGQDFGYLYYMEAADRKESVMKWRQWLNDEFHRTTTQRS